MWRVFLLLLAFINTTVFGQSVSGVVKDGKGEPLAFVNILINGSVTDGVVSDIDGKFEVSSREQVQFLEFRYLGYETLSYYLEDKDKPLEIVLQSTIFTLEQAEVIAGENPAHRIIKLVVKNRNINNPEKLPAFYCKTYNKLVFDFNSRKRSF